jgi:hypothetical protein
VAVTCVVAAVASASQVPTVVSTPFEFYGFQPGSDRKLLDYGQLTEYLEMAASASPRLEMREIGRTESGRPMYVLFISSDKNIARLDGLREINRRLALDVTMSEEELDRLVADGRVFVLAANSMHASEVGPAQSVPLLVHELATSQDPQVLDWLDQVVLMVVPTQNPDGLQMTADYYRSTVGTIYEGTSLPGVYNKYVGHDNNRDFVTLSQSETRAVSALFSTEWFPHVLLDKHQMGRTGPRYFVPEYHDPIAVNIDEDLWYWSDVFGSTMAKDLGRAGLQGVASHWAFDEYWPGATTTSHWKGVISLLTEAASCALATPVYVESNELQVWGKGLSEYKKGVNMPDPWDGGWWRLGDIVRYELTTMRSALAISTAHREELLRFRNQLSRREVERGRTEAPFHYIFPAKQHDADALDRLADLLESHGVTVTELAADVEVDGRRFREGDVVVSLDQPYRAFIKEVLETQRYPVRRYTPGGQVIRPYDVTSWSLPLHHGVAAHEVNSAGSEFATRPRSAQPREPVVLDDGDWGVAVSTRDNLGFKAVFAALADGLTVQRTRTGTTVGETRFAAGSFLISGKAAKIRSVLDRVPVQATMLSEQPKLATVDVATPRVALVETFFHHMDAGWTRFILDRYGVPHSVLRPGEIEESDLAKNFDVLVLPDTDPDILTKGRRKRGDRYDPGDMPPEYRKPISAKGFAEIRAFLDAGGTVVSWRRSTGLFLTGKLADGTDENPGLHLPARDLSQQLEDKGLYVAGSLLRMDLTSDHPVTWGMPKQAAVFSRGTPVFATSLPIHDTDRRVLGVFPETDILLSGYAEHLELLAERTALVWLRKGSGQLVLFGFSPQFRASTPATFKLLFNSLLLPPADDRAFRPK